MSAIASQLVTIIGATAVHPWDSLEDHLKTQISQAIVPYAHLDCVAYPATVAELGEVMRCAQQNRWRVLPFGRGSKLIWGGLAEGIQIAISTDRLNRLIEHAAGDLTLTAEAGIPFAKLQATLAEANQFLALDPTYTTSASLGGIVATADTGALRQRYGGIRDMLIGISFVRSDGQVVKAGGRVVKNVAGYDLMKLLTGSFGTLGIITQVTFRTYPLPEASRTIVLTGSAEAIARAVHTLLASSLTPIAAELVPYQTVANLGIGNGMGAIVRFQSLEVSVEQQSEQLRQVGQALNLSDLSLSGHDEQHLWQRLQAPFEHPLSEPFVTCKIGVLPTHAITTLNKISALLPSMQTGSIHAASGLGWFRVSHQVISAETLLDLRKLCQAQGGFLTVLEAPAKLKQAIDIWGYTGNALTIMQKLKRQFDPENLLSPHRFVGGI
jgi:glycolate oxidase FAD binding subunit